MRNKSDTTTATIVLFAALFLAMANAAAGPDDSRKKSQAHQGPHHAETQKQSQPTPDEKGRQSQTMGDKEIAGHRMLSAEEQKRFTEAMQAARNDAERERIREEHRQLIRDRAEAEREQVRKKEE